MVKKKKSTGALDLSNRELLAVLMQEISDVHGELNSKIADVHTSLKKDITNVRVEVQASRAESHQNQVAFITNIQDHERRLTVLERR